MIQVIDVWYSCWMLPSIISLASLDLTSPLAYEDPVLLELILNKAIREMCFSHHRPWISPWIRSTSNEFDIIIHVIASKLSSHCDVNSNRLWLHQRYMRIAVIVVIYGLVMSCKKYNNAWTLVTNCLCAQSSVILVLSLLVASQLGK